jgi:hypothetical protein
MSANPLPVSLTFPLDAERADRLAELVRGLDAPVADAEGRPCGICANALMY